MCVYVYNIIHESAPTPCDNIVIYYYIRARSLRSSCFLPPDDTRPPFFHDVLLPTTRPATARAAQGRVSGSTGRLAYNVICIIYRYIMNDFRTRIQYVHNMYRCTAARTTRVHLGRETSEVAIFKKSCGQPYLFFISRAIILSLSFTHYTRDTEMFPSHLIHSTDFLCTRL